MKDTKKTEDGITALTKTASRLRPIAKTRKPDVIWSHVEFGQELEKAKKIGPKKMSSNDLLTFCQGVNAYYRGHFWVDARPFFRELWDRINAGKLEMSKKEACRRIGCTRQWANEIVSGRADARRSQRASAKQVQGGNLLSAPGASEALRTNDEYVDEITELAFAKLTPLLPARWDSYRAICEELAKQFEEASKTTPIAKARGA